MSERVLLCPGCGSDYLHQYRTIVREPGGDDTSYLYGVAVYVQSVEGHRRKVPSVTVDPLNAAPLVGWGERRNAVVIDFFCEHCDRRPSLCIWQQKGQTMLGWVESSDAVEFAKEPQ